MRQSITQEGLNLIKKYEGLRTHKYICPAGIETIGYGHQIAKHEKLDEISEDEAELLLLADIKIAEKAVQKCIHIQLNDNQFSALVSFCFNLGAYALFRSTLRQKINREEHEEASHEFAKWVYVAGKKLKGLVLRRAEESQIYTSLHS